MAAFPHGLEGFAGLEKLAASLPQPGVGPEHLKYLGQRASTAYLKGDAETLTDAVQKILEEGSYSKEQIQRVVETANQETWGTMFRENGDAEAHFVPADVSNILGSVEEAPERIQVPQPHELDFMSDLPNQRLPELTAEDMESMFGAGHSEKLEPLNAYRDEVGAVEKVAGHLDSARAVTDRLTLALAEQGERVYDMIKHAFHDGVGILQMTKAIGTVVDDVHFGARLMKTASGRLRKEGIRFNEQVEMEKAASVFVVNYDHPLLEEVKKLEALSAAHYTANEDFEKLKHMHHAACATLSAKMRA